MEMIVANAMSFWQCAYVDDVAKQLVAPLGLYKGVVSAYIATIDRYATADHIKTLLWVIDHRIGIAEVEFYRFFLWREILHQSFKFFYLQMAVGVIFFFRIGKV